jgi:hypothetical protein
MNILVGLLATLIGILLGLFMFPILLFIRARRDGSWDDSNLFNIYRVLFHLAIHPSDFAKFQFPSGKKPFWYLSKDEFSDIVDSRENDMMKFIARPVNNQPELIIEGRDIDHILESRFFNTYTHDGKYDVVYDDERSILKIVKKGDKKEHGMYIGRIV